MGRSMVFYGESANGFCTVSVRFLYGFCFTYHDSQTPCSRLAGAVRFLSYLPRFLSRARPGQAKLSRAEPSRAVPSAAEPSRAEASHIESFLCFPFWLSAWPPSSLCGQPTNLKLNLLLSDSDWSRFELKICWRSLREVSC